MTNPWVAHVKEYAKNHGVTYACAIPDAAKTYTKKQTKSQSSTSAVTPKRKLTAKSIAKKQIKEEEEELQRIKRSKENEKSNKPIEQPKPETPKTATPKPKPKPKAKSKTKKQIKEEEEEKERIKRPKENEESNERHRQLIKRLDEERQKEAHIRFEEGERERREQKAMLSEDPIQQRINKQKDDERIKKLKDEEEKKLKSFERSQKIVKTKYPHLYLPWSAAEKAQKVKQNKTDNKKISGVASKIYWDIIPSRIQQERITEALESKHGKFKDKEEETKARNKYNIVPLIKMTQSHVWKNLSKPLKEAYIKQAKEYLKIE